MIRPTASRPARPAAPLPPRPARVVLLALGFAMALGPATLAQTPARAAFGVLLSPPDIADLLYRRYRAARVMRVFPTGDVYQAEVIDRRGFRVHFTIDGYNGEVLATSVVGADEEPVPLPPGLVPNVQGAPPAPRRPGDGLARPEPPGVVQSPPRQARNPDASAPGATPRLRQTPAPKLPPNPADEPGATATRQPGETPEMQNTVEPPAPVRSAPLPPPGATATAPATTLAPVIATPPVPAPSVAPAPAAPPRQEVRKAGPVTRTPEPLIDPKTGKATVPVAPLDDATPLAKPPIGIVPSATAE